VAEAVSEQNTPPRSQSIPALRLDHLWVLVALGAVGIIISISRTVPNDFWWHLKAGEMIATSGIPTTNIFAWTLPADTPFIYQSWLGEWLFYMLYQLGGLPFVVFARNMLGLAAFALVALEAQQRSGSWRLASGAVLLAALMAINNLTTRTQNWSWVPFALLLLLLGAYVRQRLGPRWLVALPLLMLFWVNAHGGFMMGILVTGAFVAGETLRRLLRQPYALSWARLRPLYIAAAAMVAITVINPLGPGIFGYVLKLLTDAPSQGLVNEWQPPSPRSVAGWFFFVSVLLMLVAFAWGRRRPTITDILLTCGLLWMAFSGARYVVWFGIAAMPILVQSLSAPRSVPVPGLGEQVRPPHRQRVGSPPINAVLALLLLLGVVAVQPWFKPALPLPETYREAFAPVPGAPLLFAADTPVEATEHLREEPCAGNLFNEMGYGSYLIWALYPVEQVFVDPRVELFPLEMWKDYVNLSQGQNAAALLDEYNIDCVLLDVEGQAGLAETMPTLAGWERTYHNEQSEVWRRASDA
jgi:hypothetical protein